MTGPVEHDAPAPAGPGLAPPVEDPAPAEEPPLVDDALLEPAGELAGLFGAAAPESGRVRPGVVVNLDGQDVAPGTVGGALPDRLVLDGLSFTWGRSDLLEHPEPSTATFQLFHPRPDGFAVDQAKIIGRPVTFRWTSPENPAGTVNFRGRVSGVRLRAREIVDADGTVVRGVEASYTATSLLTDLANRRASTQGWLRETLANRLSFLSTRLSGVVSSIVFRDYWKPAQLAPDGIVTTSVLDALAQLYDTSGVDRMVWFPDTQQLSWQGRRELTGRAQARLWWDQPAAAPTSRTGKGVYVRSMGGRFLDADALEYDPAEGISKAQGSGLSRAVVDWRDAAAADAQRTITYTATGVDETLTGERAARLDTFLNAGDWADLLARDLRDIISTEGAYWRTSPMTWDTSATDGFENLEQATILLRGAEVGSSFFVQRAWITRLGLRPLVGIIGGTLTFRAGSWVVEFQAAQIGTRDIKQHAITWEEIDDGSAALEVQWWDGDHPRGMHESLTYEDLGYVGQGLGPTIGPDTGWDTIQ